MKGKSWVILVFTLMFFSSSPVKGSTNISSENVKSALEELNKLGNEFKECQSQDREGFLRVQEKIKKYLKSLDSETVFLMAVEVAKSELENAGWILAYSGLSDWKKNPRAFLESYLFLYKHKSKITDEFKKWVEKGVTVCLKEDIEGGGMNSNQEEGVVNEGTKFLNNPANSPEEKQIIVKFLWEVWSGFFGKIVKMENKGEAYEKMNQQALLIIETLNTVRTDARLSEEADKILQNFSSHYLRKDLPAEFLQSPSIPDVREKIAQSLKKG